MRSFSHFLFVGAAVATDCQSGDFCVTSCNDADHNNRTAMFLSVDKDYMDSHHPDLLTGWTLNGNDYTRTIQGSALTLDMTNSDYIFLDYELETAQVDVTGTTDIYFAGRTTSFRCKYPRAVSVGGNYTVTDDPDPSPYVNTGVLQYDFTTTVANGRTEVVLTKQHGVPGLEANVQNCAVTYAGLANEIVYPVRNQPTWGDTDVCIDNRIATSFTYANGGATIDWRTFHFNDATATSQQHVITCDVHVSNSLTVSAPPACTNYAEFELPAGKNVLSHDICGGAWWAVTDETNNSNIYFLLMEPGQTWTSVTGGLSQIVCDDQIGVFGVNSNDDLWYRKGSNVNPAVAGSQWQYLPYNGNGYSTIDAIDGKLHFETTNGENVIVDEIQMSGVDVSVVDWNGCPVDMRQNSVGPNCAK